jgi:two-component system, NarL family, invasion response regulator UvrY
MPMLYVLIVEDNLDTVDIMVGLLRAGLGPGTISHASHGAEALRLFREAAWDLVLLDISLPDMSGLALLAQLKSEASGQPILILSNRYTPQRVDHCLDHGALGYVAKEDAVRELIPAIHSIFDGRQYLSQCIHHELNRSHASRPGPTAAYT